MVPGDSVQFSAPRWVRDQGFASWLLVGFVLIIVGVSWLLGQTSTIVMPVILAAVLGAVAGPAVGRLEHHRVPRIGGAILVLLGLVAIGVLVILLVVGGISAQSGDISTKLNQALDKLQRWLDDLRVDNAQQATADVNKDPPEIRTTLLSGISTSPHARTRSGHDIETSPNLDDDAAGYAREAVGPTRWSRIVTATR